MNTILENSHFTEKRSAKRDCAAELINQRSTVIGTTLARLAARERRILITLDLDFGELFWSGESRRAGVVVLRLDDQTVESVNRTLERLLASTVFATAKTWRALVVADENRVRIRLP